MNCGAWEGLLQRLLDGEGAEGTLREHLSVCPDCAAHRQDVSRLLDGLARLKPAPVPVGLTARLNAALTAEARLRPARRWRPRVGFAGLLAVAAGLMLAVGLWALRPKPVVERPPVVENIQHPEPLRDQAGRAGEAVASLTLHAASDTVKQSASLVPALTPEPLANVSTPVEPRIEQPLREAADGVSTGLAPVTDSARRAVSLFLRDMSGGKPG